MDVKISVIIPVYNSAKFVSKAIESVLSQTSRVHEIIVVDDGSTDDTVNLVRKYPVRIFTQSNGGAAKARNRGIAEATGDWISFLDSDDWWDERKIEKTKISIINNPDCKMFATNMYKGSEEEGWFLVDMCSRYNPKSNFFKQLFRRSFLATSTLTVFRESVLEVGGFDLAHRCSQDLDLWLRMSRKNKLFFLSEPLTYYYHRLGSSSYNPSGVYVNSLQIFDKNSKYVSKKLYLTRVLVLCLTTTLIHFEIQNYKEGLIVLIKLPKTLFLRFFK